MSSDKPVQPSGQDTPAQVYQRMLVDLLRSERQAKKAAQEEAGELAQVLAGLAQRLAGERCQELRGQDPLIFQTWTAQQWRVFFQQLPMVSTSEFQARIAGLEKRLGDQQKELAYARARSARQEREAALQRLDRAKQALRQQYQTEQSQAQTLLLDGAALGLTPPGEDGPARRLALACPQYADALQRVTELIPPAIPARFSERLATPGSRDAHQRWERQTRLLYLLSQCGLANRSELELLLCAHENRALRSNSAARIIDGLLGTKLITKELYRVQWSAFRSNLDVLRPTQDGRELCNLLGWKVGMSEWQRLQLKRLGADEMYAILTFAMQARLRGWTVDVLPDAPAGSPEAYVSRSSERYFVLLCLQETLDTVRGQAVAGLQDGRVVVCAGTDAQRARLVSICREARLPGAATSLESLVQVRLPDLRPETPLWLEQWNA